MGYLIGGAGEGPEKEIKGTGEDLSHLTDEQLRDLHKQTTKEVTKWSNFQMVRKICLNSLYGALGNNYFRYYKLANAEAVTSTGQVTIRWIERKLNEYLNKSLKTEDQDYVIASDTDSIYLDLGPLVSRVFGDDAPASRVVPLLNQLCEDKITRFIDESYDELSEYLNCYEKTLVMKRECIAQKGIWTAKKRYILNVWDNEGVRYDEPKLKMMGIEAVKSSTPAPCRGYIKDALKIIMEGTEQELIEFIDEKRLEFSTLPPELISFPRSASNVLKYTDHNTVYVKGTPLHIRGCVMFNHQLKQKKLTHKYNLINDGEKIKFTYLKLPNPSHENVIAFISELPKEFGLKDFIDYDTMYEKSFIEPLKLILDTIGWRTEKTAQLDLFFT
jgi:DNA polymerase elongation subunit (family B)